MMYFVEFFENEIANILWKWLLTNGPIQDGSMFHTIQIEESSLKHFSETPKLSSHLTS